MIVSFRGNRRRMAVLLALIAVLAAAYFALCRGGAETAQRIAGGTNTDRLAFIHRCGWTVEAEPCEVAEVRIPAEFNEVYRAYNALQQGSGFDLLPYAGKMCTRYVYTVTNYRADGGGDDAVRLSLLVCEEEIIGGDVASAQLGGFMHGLKDGASAQTPPETESDQNESAAE